MFKKQIIERNDKETLYTVESECGKYVIQKEVIGYEGQTKESELWSVYDGREHVGEYKDLKDAKQRVIQRANGF